MDIISFMSNAEKQAYQTIALCDEIRRLRDIEEAYEELQRKYDELLQSGIDHSQKMIGGMLELCLVTGVMTAIRDNAEASAEVQQPGRNDNEGGL